MQHSTRFFEVWFKRLMVLIRREWREGNLYLLSKCLSCLATEGLMQIYKQLLQKTWKSDDLR